jgi:Lipid A 3-O-deacylase (PagL)
VPISLIGLDDYCFGRWISVLCRFLFGACRVKKIRFSPILFLFGVVCLPGTFAQAGPEGAASEWQMWTGGGHAINGSTSSTGVWNLGLRYGIVITSPHGPGFLKGQLEYALDVVPAWVIIQPTTTAYGGGIDPFAFKWILSKPRKVKPYFEIGGGTLFTNTKVPEGTSQINFTTGGALGAHFLGDKRNFSVEVRFMHISNAGMTKPNPGINTVQVRIGLGVFRK